MGYVRKIKAGLVKTDLSEFIGADPGIIFYDNITGEFRISDGVTPGGKKIIGDAGTDLTSFSINQEAADGYGALAYDNTTGEFTYTPPDFINLGGSPFQWTTSGTGSQFRTSDTWRENEQIYVIREVKFVNGKLRVELASFSPGLTAYGQSLEWDQVPSQWSVYVNNPADFVDMWIEAVEGIAGTTGTFSAFGTYSPGAKSATAGGGIDWSQNFSIDNGAFVRPNVSSGTSGGSASAEVSFTVNDGTNTSTHTDTSSVTFTWQSIGATTTFTNKSGNNWFDPYEQAQYTVNVSGLNDISNVSHSASINVGSLQSAQTGVTKESYWISFPLWPNSPSNRTISTVSTFTRPTEVTGTSYTTNINSSDTFIGYWNYPSFYKFYADPNSIIELEDIIINNGGKSSPSAQQPKRLASGVTVLQANAPNRNIDQIINNPDIVPQSFTYFHRASLGTATVFKTGADASLLADVAPTSTGQIDLYHDDDQTASSETFNWYRITLQPGDTYLRIQ